MALNQFLGSEIDKIPIMNSSRTREFRNIYNCFKDRLTIPMEMINKIYDTAYIKHFYSAEEIAGFKNQWSVEKHN